MNKFTLDTTFHALPTIWIGDRGLTIRASEEQAQELVDWLNVALDAEYAELVEQRAMLLDVIEIASRTWTHGDLKEIHRDAALALVEVEVSE